MRWERGLEILAMKIKNVKFSVVCLYMLTLIPLSYSPLSGFLSLHVKETTNCFQDIVRSTWHIEAGKAVNPHLSSFHFLSEGSNASLGTNLMKSTSVIGNSVMG